MKAYVRLVTTLLTVLIVPMGTGAHAAKPTYSDPFRYCAAVGTIDRPDSRYVGPRVPIAVAIGLRSAYRLPDSTPLEPFMRATHWRCMGGDLYACTVGANLPCQEKADVNRRPTQAMVTYCASNLEVDHIPAYVTGRATTYLWRCIAGQPWIVRQVTKPDAQGYLSNIWYRILPDEV